MPILALASHSPAGSLRRACHAPVTELERLAVGLQPCVCVCVTDL